MFTTTLGPRARTRIVHVACALLVAIGFAACLAVIAVVRGTLTAPLPYGHADRILALHVQSASLNSSEIPFAWPDWLDVKAGSRTLDDVALARNQTFTLADDALPLRVEGARVTPNLAQFLGVPLLLGGGFTGRPGEAVPEAVLSERLWRVHFGGRDDVLGRSITLSGATYAVVGVLPAGVRFPSNDVDVWIPLVPAANELNRNFRFARAYGRVHEDATVAEARDELRSIMDGLQRLYPDSNRDIQAAPVPLRDVYVAAQRPLLVTLAVVVGLVLLVVCGNVAGLLMSQVVSSSGQYALRLALGASRRGIVLTLLRGTVPPVLGGVVIGSLAAAAALAVIGLGPSEDLRATRVAVDQALVAWAAIIALVVIAIVTVLPAALLARVGPTEALRSGSKGATLGNAGHRLIGTFVAGQLTLTFVVIAAALVAHAGALRLARTDVGFARDDTLLFALAIPERDLPSSATLWRRVAEKLGELPGVDAAGLLGRPPLFAG
ncbi:MAG TPA: ABC transporter permease, partial [Xanthomonadales bacterium]|nr:ABC transporter permease [Xanthomonadales bacterium]